MSSQKRLLNLSASVRPAPSRNAAPPSASPGEDRKQKRLRFLGAFFALKFNPGGDLRSRAVTRAVSSARQGLTSVFGMGTGVALAVRPPGNSILEIQNYFSEFRSTTEGSGQPQIPLPKYRNAKSGTHPALSTHRGNSNFICRASMSLLAGKVLWSSRTAD